MQYRSCSHYRTDLKSFKFELNHFECLFCIANSRDLRSGLSHQHKSATSVTDKFQAFPMGVGNTGFKGILASTNQRSVGPASTTGIPPDLGDLLLSSAEDSPEFKDFLNTLPSSTSILDGVAISSGSLPSPNTQNWVNSQSPSASHLAKNIMGAPLGMGKGPHSPLYLSQKSPQGGYGSQRSPKFPPRSPSAGGQRSPALGFSGPQSRPPPINMMAPSPSKCKKG